MYQESLRVDIPNSRTARGSQSPCGTSGPMEFPQFFQGLPSETDLFTQGQSAYAGLASRESEGNEMLFHDPAQVQQWADSSALPITTDREYSEDMSRGVSHWSSYPADAVGDGPLFSSCGQNHLRTGTPGSASTSTGAAPTSLFDTNEAFDSFAGDANISYEGWPTKNNQSYECNSTIKNPFRTADASHKVCLGSNEYWLNASLSQEDLTVPGLYSADHTAWSSPSTSSVEPSLASSYSQGGLFPGNLGSPTSLPACEDLSSTASMDEPVSSPFALGPAHSLYGTDASQSCDAARFVYPFATPSLLTIDSTLRPSNGFQRPSLPYWTPNENFHVPIMHPTEFYGMSRRPSSDGENTARRNELYQIGPKDGLYHCPFAATEGCTHKPEKLKCNYE